MREEELLLDRSRKHNNPTRHIAKVQIEAVTDISRQVGSGQQPSSPPSSSPPSQSAADLLTWKSSFGCLEVEEEVEEMKVKESSRRKRIEQENEKENWRTF